MSKALCKTDILKKYTKEIIENYSKQNMTVRGVGKWLKDKTGQEFNPNTIAVFLKKNGLTLRTQSQAQKLALDIGRHIHPTQGKKRTKDEKQKISVSMSSFWDNLSDLERADRVEKSKEIWNNISDEVKAKMKENALTAIREAAKNGSKMELALRALLDEASISYQFHVKNLENENLEVDFYIPGYKLVIEIDGPSHFLPIWGADKLKKQIKADAEKNGLLLNRGYKILRVKNFADRINLKVKRELTEIINHIKTQFYTKNYYELELN